MAITPEQREIRMLRKQLKDLVITVDLFLRRLDDEMRTPSDGERGKRIAKLSNALEMAKDQARHFGLGEKL